MENDGFYTFKGALGAICWELVEYTHRKDFKREITYSDLEQIIESIIQILGEIDPTEAEDLRGRYEQLFSYYHREIEELPFDMKRSEK